MAVMEGGKFFLAWLEIALIIVARDGCPNLLCSQRISNIFRCGTVVVSLRLEKTCRGASARKEERPVGQMRSARLMVKRLVRVSMTPL